MSWRSSIGRNRFPNVFDQNFSWYQDNPKDDPLRASKISPSHQEQAPQDDSSRLALQTAAPQDESVRRNSTMWIIVLIVVLAAALFLFAR